MSQFPVSRKNILRVATISCLATLVFITFTMCNQTKSGNGLWSRSFPCSLGILERSRDPDQILGLRVGLSTKSLKFPKPNSLSCSSTSLLFIHPSFPPISVARKLEGGFLVASMAHSKGARVELGRLLCGLKLSKAESSVMKGSWR